MNTVHERDVNMLELPGRCCRVIVGGDHLKADYLTFGVTEVPPGAKMSPHTHEREEEVIYILQGWGEVVVDGIAEKLEKGTTIYLRVGSEHHIENKSSETMRFTFSFSPPVKIGSYEKG